MRKPIRLSIEGHVPTSPIGCSKIIDFYKKARIIKNEPIHVDLSQMKWFDANLCAVLGALLFKLHYENGLTFIFNKAEIQDKFEVLFRNKFIPMGGLQYDDRESTVPFGIFRSNDKDGFIKYIEEDLMTHRGMPILSDTLKLQIEDDIIEIFTNTHLHANTSYPFFICGQFYPRHCQLILTMVDLGVGFLPTIRKFTNNKIRTSANAILWTLQGRSTKPPEELVPGGLGIGNMYKYFNNNGGHFQIMTGNAFWGTNVKEPKGIMKLMSPFYGTTINLIFKCN